MLFRGMRQEMNELRQEIAAVRELLDALLQPVAPYGELPPDMPARDVLVSAGITTRSAIPKTIRQLEQVPGIDEGAAMAIARYLIER